MSAGAVLVERGGRWHVVDATGVAGPYRRLGEGEPALIGDLCVVTYPSAGEAGLGSTAALVRLRAVGPAGPGVRG